MTLSIVKLGGSAAFAADLPGWLDLLAGLGGAVCIVPGGGPFAETVRHAQPRMGFDDTAAHRMAILAMEQYAHALLSLCPALKPVATCADIVDSAKAGSASLWFPADMALQPDAPAASWDVTSDTYAVWLARRCRANRVILIKQSVPAQDDPAALARQGFVDAALPRFVGDWSGELLICGPGDQAALRAAIAGAPHGLRCIHRGVARGAA